MSHSISLHNMYKMMVNAFKNEKVTIKTIKLVAEFTRHACFAHVFLAPEFLYPKLWHCMAYLKDLINFSYINDSDRKFYQCDL